MCASAEVVWMYGCMYGCIGRIDEWTMLLAMHPRLLIMTMTMTITMMDDGCTIMYV